MANMNLECALRIMGFTIFELEIYTMELIN
jgi:hypothetical protein